MQGEKLTRDIDAVAGIVTVLDSVHDTLQKHPEVPGEFDMNNMKKQLKLLEEIARKQNSLLEVFQKSYNDLVLHVLSSTKNAAQDMMKDSMKSITTQMRNMTNFVVVQNIVQYFLELGRATLYDISLTDGGNEISISIQDDTYETSLVIKVERTEGSGLPSEFLTLDQEPVRDFDSQRKTLAEKYQLPKKYKDIAELAQDLKAGLYANYRDDVLTFLRVRDANEEAAKNDNNVDLTASAIFTNE